LIDDERNLPILLKRCCHAAARAQFVPPWAIQSFFFEVIQQPNWTLQWCTAVRWWNTIN
jgi:hypothetical protein